MNTTARNVIGYGLAGAGALLPALFGGDDSGLGSSITDLQKMSDSSREKGDQFHSNSQDLFKQVLPYLQAVTSGDRTALLNATMPERRRVMDQYDAARKAIAEFAPRSGGTAAANLDMRAKQAGDLAEIGSTARREGMNAASGLGATMAGLGLNATGQAIGATGHAANIQSFLAQQKAQSAGSWGEALGLIAGMIIP